MARKIACIRKICKAFWSRSWLSQAVPADQKWRWPSCLAYACCIRPKVPEGDRSFYRRMRPLRTFSAAVTLRQTRVYRTRKVASRTPRRIFARGVHGEDAYQTLTIDHNSAPGGPTMANTGRNFSLTERQQRFVSEQVANGRHASGSEVIREALRRYEDDILSEPARLAALNKLAEEGEAAYMRGEYTRLSNRQEVRAFIRKSGARAISRSPEHVA